MLYSTMHIILLFPALILLYPASTPNQEKAQAGLGEENVQRSIRSDVQPFKEVEFTCIGCFLEPQYSERMDVYTYKCMKIRKGGKGT